MADIYLSVVIPCFNEERNIRLGALENVSHFLSRKEYPWEVIIVDDGSSDESRRLINQFITDQKKFYLISRKHQGKAAAVTAGILKANGSYILFTDLDQATPVSEVDKILPQLTKDYDIVIGSRNTRRRGAPLLRRLMARGFMMLRNLILDLGINDTQCGFKAFKRNAAYDIFPKLQVYSLKRQVYGSTVTAGFDVEVLYLAKNLGYRIAEVPVEWHYQETRHVNFLKDSYDGLVDLIKIRWNAMRGIYNK